MRHRPASALLPFAAFLILPGVAAHAADRVEPAQATEATTAAENDPVNRALWMSIGHPWSSDPKIREAVLAATSSGDPDVLLLAWRYGLPREDGKESPEWLRLAASKGSLHAALAYSTLIMEGRTPPEARTLLEPFVEAGNPYATYTLGRLLLQGAAKQTRSENRSAEELIGRALAGMPPGHPFRGTVLSGLGVAEMHTAETPADFARSARHSLEGWELEKERNDPPPIALILLSRGDDEASAKVWMERLLKLKPVEFPKPPGNPRLLLMEDAEPLDSPKRYASRLLNRLPPEAAMRYMRLYDIRIDKDTIPILLPAVAAGDPESIRAVAYLARPVYDSTSHRASLQPWQVPLLDALKTAAAKRSPEAVDVLTQNEPMPGNTDATLDAAIANLVAGGTQGIKGLETAWIYPFMLRNTPSYPGWPRRITKPRELNPHFAFLETLSTAEGWRDKVESAAIAGDKDAGFIRALLRLGSNRMDVRDTGVADMKNLAEAGDAEAMYCLTRIPAIGAERTRWLEAAANAGQRDALFTTGWTLFHPPEGKPADVAEAYRRLKRAASMDDSDAFGTLATLLKEHPEVSSVPGGAGQERETLLKEVSRRRGLHTRESEDFQATIRARMTWMNELSQKGDAIADMLLGIERYDPDPKGEAGRRYRALRRASIAEVPEAFMLKAAMHRQEGQFFSPAEADACLKRAAELGLEAAKTRISPGSPDSPGLRDALEKKALAESGFMITGAKQSLLAMILRDDATDAELDRAARVLDSVDASQRTGSYSYDLWSFRLAQLRKDYRKALYHLTREVVVRANRNDGHMLDRPREYAFAQSLPAMTSGNGEPDGFEASVLTKLAARGHRPAMWRLAGLQIDEYDRPAAAKLLLESLAASGYPGAGRRLALLLATYPASPGDFSEGVARLEKLASSGNPDAVRDRKLFSPVKDFDTLRNTALGGDQNAVRQLAYLLSRNVSAGPHPLLPATAPDPLLASAYFNRLARDEDSGGGTETPEYSPSIRALILRPKAADSEAKSQADLRVRSEIEAYGLRGKTTPQR